MLIYLLFGYTCLLALIGLYLFPSLLFFAPFLILVFYRSSLFTSLWWALGSGLIVDLLCANPHFGMHALNYCLVTRLLYPQQRHFFQDRLSTLPLMTFLFVALFALLERTLFGLLEEKALLSWNWFLQHLLIIPFRNSLYTIIAFTLPSLFLFQLIRRGFFALLSRR